MPDEFVHAWVRGLPANGNVVVVSLLGRKLPPSKKDEWSFYSFHKENRSFRDWLNQHYARLGIEIIEHPTTDACPIEDKVLETVSSDISRLLREGRTVVVMDSGGVGRVGQVCKHIQRPKK